MDKFQESKYWSLFWAYQPSVPSASVAVKRRVIETLKTDRRLRADSAYFLLLNFDQMIARVAKEPFPSRFSPYERDLNDDKFLVDKVDKAFDIIIEGLGRQAYKDELGYSAHDVIKTISEVWDILAPIFAWA